MPNHDGLFDSVRGMGLMLGIKLKSESRAFVAHLRDNHGLLTVDAGDNVVRILPPLNIGQGHIDECIEILSAGAARSTPPESRCGISWTCRTPGPMLSRRCWPTRSTARRPAPAGQRAGPMTRRR